METSNQLLQRQTWVLSRTPGTWTNLTGPQNGRARGDKRGHQGWRWEAPVWRSKSPALMVLTVSGCWLRWVCRGVGLGGLGGGPLAGSIQHGGRWGLPVVTLHLWQGGKQLPSLLEAHYSISPEGSHWGTLSLLLLSPPALSLCRSFLLLSSSERLNWSFFVFDQLFSHSQVSLELCSFRSFYLAYTHYLHEFVWWYSKLEYHQSNLS